MHWWRGSFWLMAPFMLAFAVIALDQIPHRLDTEAERGALPPFPFFRLTMLASSVFAVAAINAVDNIFYAGLCLIAAIALVSATFCRPRGRQQAVPLACIVLPPADRPVPLDVDPARDGADRGDLVPPALAASRPRRLAGVRQFRYHQDLFRVDDLYLSRLPGWSGQRERFALGFRTADASPRWSASRWSRPSRSSPC